MLSSIVYWEFWFRPHRKSNINLVHRYTSYEFDSANEFAGVIKDYRKSRYSFSAEKRGNCRRYI